MSLREETLKRALQELPDRERTVVALRYGIDGGEPTPLREIGRQLGITPERVRQIESKALGRLGRMRELGARCARRRAVDSNLVRNRGRCPSRALRSDDRGEGRP